MRVRSATAGEVCRGQNPLSGCSYGAWPGIRVVPIKTPVPVERGLPAELWRSGAAAPAALVLQPPRLQCGSAGVGTRKTFAGGAPAPLRGFERASGVTDNLGMHCFNPGD